MAFRRKTAAAAAAAMLRAVVLDRLEMKLQYGLECVSNLRWGVEAIVPACL